MDIYFACLMDFEEADLEKLKLCERQLSDYKWVPLEQYGKFGEEHSIGTQKYLAKYISSLAQKGFDFTKQSTPYSQGYEYVSSRDYLKRFVVQHQMARI